jgi:hypothetical protein
MDSGLMITIFGEKIAFLIKNQSYDPNFAKQLAEFLIKNGRKYFKGPEALKSSLDQGSV